MSKVKIAFVSCMNHKKFPDQPQWLKIAEQEPDYLFLLGDSIYMDYFSLWFNPEHLGGPKKYKKEFFEETLDNKYKEQWQEPHFSQLLKKMEGKVFGIWDDHDFAWNNAWGNAKDFDPEIKEISRRLFHKWVNCSTNLPEVYYDLDIGDRARVIFLDNRYYADLPGPENAKMIGDDQFKFLTGKLNHDKQYTIICAGLTLTYSKCSWSKFNNEYAGFCDLVEDKKNVIFLGGDIHQNKFGPPQPAGLFRRRRPVTK